MATGNTCSSIQGPGRLKSSKRSFLSRDRLAPRQPPEVLFHGAQETGDRVTGSLYVGPAERFDGRAGGLRPDGGYLDLVEKAVRSGVRGGEPARQQPAQI